MKDIVFSPGANEGARATATQQSLTACIIVVLLGISCGLMTLRIGSLQPEDFVLLGLLWLCITKFVFSGFSLRISPQIRPLFTAYSLFLVSLVLMGVVAFRLNAYPLDEASFLKQPILFSASKLLQLIAVVCGFFWLANSFARHRSLLRLALNAYWWTGIVTCLYGIACYAYLKLHPFDAPDLFGAYTLEEFTRARGFFNEGGPLGIYAVSVLMVGLLRRRVTGYRLGVVSTTVLCLAFFLSGSKSGFLVAAALILVFAFSSVSAKARIFYCTFALAGLWGLALWMNFNNQVAGYLYSYMNIEEEIAERGRDYNLVVGRVSALHIVPKMIATHPLAGIGFGNYPLMRNDPDYLDGLPAITEVEDLPGLGLLGVAAEIGLPATVGLIVLLFVPYWTNRRRDLLVASAALFQPMAHIFGMQITFFLPWFVTALALGVSSCRPVGSVCHTTDPSSAPVVPSLGMETLRLRQ